MKDLIDEYLFHKNEEIEIVLKLVRLNNKYKYLLDKIKEYIKENANANVDYILELLEEIE
jgi:hypothetical protein